MALSDRLKSTGVSVPTTGGGLSSRLKKTARPKANLETSEGLEQYAAEQGVEIKKKDPKLSVLQRISAGLGAFNPAEAILTGVEKGAGAGLLEYPKRIITGLGSAITGKEYDKDRRHFKEVAEKAGIDNSILKFGIGFAGDVLLDPTTYFGGAMVKGLGFTAKGAGKATLKGIAKVAPETEQGLKMAGRGLQDALGRAFQYGYRASGGAKDDVLTFLSKQQRAKLGLASSNLNRLGTGTLTPAQSEELALKMIAGKRAEFVAREGGQVAETLPKVSPYLQPLAQEAKPFVLRSDQPTKGGAILGQFATKEEAQS